MSQQTISVNLEKGFCIRLVSGKNIIRNNCKFQQKGDRICIISIQIMCQQIRPSSLYDMNLRDDDSHCTLQLLLLYISKQSVSPSQYVPVLTLSLICIDLQGVYLRFVSFVLVFVSALEELHSQGLFPRDMSEKFQLSPSNFKKNCPFHFSFPSTSVPQSV